MPQRKKNVTMAIVGCQPISKPGLQEILGVRYELEFFKTVEEVDPKNCNVVFDVTNCDREIAVYYPPNAKSCDLKKLDYALHFHFPQTSLLDDPGIADDPFKSEFSHVETVSWMFYLQWLAYRLCRVYKDFAHRNWEFCPETLTIVCTKNLVRKETCPLTSMETRIFSILDSQPKFVLTRETLLRMLYGTKKNSYDNLKPILTSLRKKLSEVGIQMESKKGILKIWV